MGRQESPQLIERKGQVDTDDQEISRASKYCNAAFTSSVFAKVKLNMHKMIKTYNIL